MVHGGLPPDVIEEIRARNDIVQVVGDYVSLRKSGRNLAGLCPFHGEKTPSFTVSPEKQMFYCFGCGAGGDVYRFLMLKEKLGFAEAARLLAERAGVTLPSRRLTAEEARQAAEREELEAACQFAARYYHELLLSQRTGEGALDYLRGRGLKAATVEQFLLGYAPDAWDTLLKAGRARGFAPELLEKAGLAVRRAEGDGRYDFFRNRLIFPIHNARGKVVGFGGRVLGDGSPKYLNSAENALFSKGRNLYGLHLARETIRRSGTVLVVEGYMDAIACHEHGLAMAVASLGTSLTREQARLLLPYAAEVVIAYDADEAGQAATVRGMEILREAGCRVKVARLPPGVDPDSLIRGSGPDSFRSVAEAAMPLVDYKIWLVLRDADLGSPAGKAAAARELVGVLAAVEDAVEREAYVGSVADRLGLPEEAVRAALGRLAATRRRRGSDRKAGEGENSKDTEQTGVLVESGVDAARARTEQELLSLLLVDADAVARAKGELALESFVVGHHRKIAKILFDLVDSGRELSPQAVLDMLDDESAVNLVSRLAMEEEKFADRQRHLGDCLRKMREFALAAELAAIQVQIAECERRGEARRVLELMARFQELQELRRETRRAAP